MRKLIYIIVVLTFAWAQPVYADETNTPFDSWIELVKFMRSQGIEPTNVDWHYVEPLCAAQLQDGQQAYNRCRYEKAELSLLHANDRQECSVVAESDYPRGSIRVSRTYYPIRHRLSGHQFIADRINIRELDTHRRAGVIRCMRSLGWASASDWRLGLR